MHHDRCNVNSKVFSSSLFCLIIVTRREYKKEMSLFVLGDTYEYLPYLQFFFPTRRRCRGYKYSAQLATVLSLWLIFEMRFAFAVTVRVGVLVSSPFVSDPVFTSRVSPFLVSFCYLTFFEGRNPNFVTFRFQPWGSVYWYPGASRLVLVQTFGESSSRFFLNIVGCCWCGSVLWYSVVVGTTCSTLWFSVGVRQLGSSVFHIRYMVAVFVISTHLGVSWYTRFCTPIMF